MKRILSLACLLLALTSLQAQEAPVTRTFGGLSLINGHSVETLAPGHLNFRVAHRFGLLDGIGTFFGLDGTANFRLGLAYGLSPRLTLGVGRSRLDKQYDGYAKFKLLAQRRGGMPLTLTLLGGTAINSEALKPGEETYRLPSHRLSYHSQILLGRKFGERLSLQLAPTLVHRNLTAYASEANTFFALGGAFRWQLSHRFALTGEYYRRFAPGASPVATYTDPLGLGFDIETPLHRFQLQFTNAFGLVEPAFLSGTTGHPLRDLRFGFNISRIFR